MEEGLEKISAYTEMWIKKVFIDFLNLSMYSLSEQMINVKNEGFKKLIKKEINSQNEEYINLVNCLTDLHLQISEIKNVCYTFRRAQKREWTTAEWQKKSFGWLVPVTVMRWCCSQRTARWRKSAR